MWPNETATCIVSAMSANAQAHLARSLNQPTPLTIRRRHEGLSLPPTIKCDVITFVKWWIDEPMESVNAAVSNHEAVFAVLLSAGAPMTAYEILKLLRSDRRWAPTTVYRALQRLIDTGLIHRVESLNSYVVCSHDHHGIGTAMFVICRGCGRVDELAEGGHIEHIKSVVRAHGFRPEKATIELIGYCSNCERDGRRGRFRGQGLRDERKLRLRDDQPGTPHRSRRLRSA
jgi:Fur family zinc uptake transcriptional regulator